MIKNKEKIYKIIDEFKNIFYYQNKKLLYDQNTQKKASELLESLAALSETFERTAKLEKDNIKNDLTVIDYATGKNISLIESNISERVKKVLKKNNIYTCLKSLALSNKCVHTYDRDINSIKNNIVNYYKIINEKSTITVNNLVFSEKFCNVFKDININNLYNMNNFTDNNFKDTLKKISNPDSLDKNIKIATLKNLNINFNPKDTLDIDKKYKSIDKEKLIKSFIYKKYSEGIEIEKLQNQIFAIKDNYISMIGQLLKQNRFLNIKYELVKRYDPNNKKSIDNQYMLIIDDKDLSYYIEVHMPNFIAHKLINKYGLVESKNKSTPNLGASAIYYRDKEEVKNIKKALDNHTLIPNTRSLVITRDYEIEEEPAEVYKFITDKIEAPYSKFEEFLKDNNLYQKELNENRLLLLNENYEESTLKNIIYNNYIDIYNTFDKHRKIDFIAYSFKKMQKGDVFDKIFLDQVKKNNLNKLDVLGKILIYEKELKSDFLKNNQIYNSDIVLDIEKYINNYINSYNNFNEYIYNKEDHNDRKNRR